MICKNCGAEISDGLLFCPKCSSRIQGDIKDSAQNASSQNNLESNNNFVPPGGSIENKEIPSYSNNPYYNNSYNSYTAPDYTYDKKSSRKGPGIVLTILGIITIIFFIYRTAQYYIRSTNPDAATSTSLFFHTEKIHPEIDIEGKWTGISSDNISVSVEVNLDTVSLDLPDENIKLNDLSYNITKSDSKTVHMVLTNVPSNVEIDNLHFAFLNKNTVILTMTLKNGTQGEVKLDRVKQ